MSAAPGPAPSERSTQAEADRITAEVRDRVRDRVRVELRRHGASVALEDPAVLGAVESLLHRAAEQQHPGALLLTQILGEPSTWRLETALTTRSHRGGAAAAALVFVKTRLVLPVVRWVFEFSRDNFERQQRVNQVLFAAVQELAIENTRLRAEVERLAGR
ncbi:MAG: hypothetical protein AB7I25_00170 [Vicinamibacterales bacterium]